MSGDAGYTDQEAPILEKMIMDSRCEKTKSESWARDEITRLREENARLREALSYYAEEDYNGYNGSGACARAAIQEGGKDEN